MHHEEGNRNPGLKISYTSRPDAERETTKSGLLSDSLVGQRRSLHKRETRLRPQFIPIECRALSQPDIGPRPLAERPKDLTQGPCRQSTASSLLLPRSQIQHRCRSFTPQD